MTELAPPFDEMEERVIALFHESIEVKMQTGEQLAPVLADTSHLLAQTLLQESKVLIAGNGASAANAQVLALHLNNRFKQDRPGFAALALNSDFVGLTGIACDRGFQSIFEQPINALGQPGDALVLFSHQANESNLIPAIGAAHAREMNVIVFSGGQESDLPSMLDEHDIEIAVEHSDASRVHEVHLLSLYSLCELIDMQLFGV